MGAVECSGEKPQFEKLLKYFSSDEMLRCWWHFLGRLVHSQKKLYSGSFVALESSKIFAFNRPFFCPLFTLLSGSLYKTGNIMIFFISLSGCLGICFLRNDDVFVTDSAVSSVLSMSSWLSLFSVSTSSFSSVTDPTVQISKFSVAKVSVFSDWGCDSLSSLYCKLSPRLLFAMYGKTNSKCF